ncbi:unnamed protein product [Prorocentrum cordatum]|uniref:EF-hand domain-containing protein n=1 Tax=Prorocentrum cordatum TaxID=2364126 RepID=A0ABN9SA76_9DINO|nr:unnamed protein product [Polarella glacialis]
MGAGRGRIAEASGARESRVAISGPRLGRHELEPTLRNLQPDLSKPQLDALFGRFDQNGNGQVELHEFCRALEAPAQARQANAPPLHQPAATVLGQPAAWEQDILTRIASSVARLGRRPEDLFRQLDANNDGRLGRHELEPTLRSLQPDLSPQQLDALFRLFDSDGNGEVELLEFCGALDNPAGRRRDRAPASAQGPAAVGSQHDVLARISSSIARLGRRPDELFFQLDANRDGRLTRQELEPTLRSLQPDISPQQLDAIIRRFDIDGNGEAPRDIQTCGGCKRLEHRFSLHDGIRDADTNLRYVFILSLTPPA